MSARLHGALVGGCASTVAFDACASGSPLTRDGMLMLASMLALWLCIAAVSLVIALFRWRRRGRRGLWYLLVPAEVAVMTFILLPLLDSLIHDGVMLIALPLCVQLGAWAIAHLMHRQSHAKT